MTRRYALLALTARLLGFIGAIVSAASLACSSGRSSDEADETPALDSAAAAPAGAAPSQQNRVTLSEAAFTNARIEVAKVQVEGVGDGGVIEIPGQVVFDSTRVAVISPRSAGRIERLVAAPGDRVSRGQTVAYLSSPQYLTAQSDFVQAMRRAALVAGTPDAQGAQALVSAARRRLVLLGAGEERLSQLAGGGDPTLTLAVAAPFGGSILDVQALPGTAVAPGSPIFRIADLSTVNVIGDVPERALAAVRGGQRALIHVPAYPGDSFAGRVVRAKDELDPTTRSAKVVIDVPNPGRRLKPGMFAAVRLQVRRGGSRPGEKAGRTISVSDSAVMSEGETRYVFVQLGPRTFERRVVQLAPPLAGVSTGGRVAVKSGLEPGERVVVRGAFVLRSELGKASFGEPEG